MKEMLIDTAWRFRLGECARASFSEFDDSQWRLLDVPHDWSIELPRSSEHPSGDQGGFFADGVGWYRKHLELAPGWEDKRIAIEFEGIYRGAEVWLNGHYLGLHPYGYTTFLLDLTPYLHHDGTANILAVRVDNSTHRHTRWYSGSGIYRHVRLRATEPIHVAHWGVAVTTPEVTHETASVRVCTRVHNESADDANVSVRWEIVDPNGLSVGWGVASAGLLSGLESDLETLIDVAQPCLWSPDSPALYHVDIELSAGGTVVDSSRITFGIRTFSFSATEGFILNGEHMLLHGGCVHHDCGPLGAASIDRAEERKVEILKKSGYNAVRCAHNPPSPAFLHACDRLGMLVIDEAFDVWRAPKLPHDYHRHFDDWWERDLDSMLLRDRNHPSIILWSIGNEVVERGLPEGAKIARRLADHVRAVDPSRPITAGVCDVWNGGGWGTTDGLFEVLDVCGYNYRLDAYEEDHARFPKRVILAAESFPAKALDYWEAVKRLPYVVGDFVWTSLDYLGEAGIGHTTFEEDGAKQLPGWPWNQANCGDIDLCGWKRPQSHYRDIIWGLCSGPVIAVHPPTPAGKTVAVSSWGWHDVQSRWNWDGCEGSALRVDVYADCDKVELFLNAVSLGCQPAGVDARYLATFEVPYEPGELQASAWVSGKVTAKTVIRSSGPAVAIRMVAERNPIRAAQDDLAYIAVCALDAAGQPVPTADQPVFLTVSGPGRIAAVANADPRNMEAYRGNRTRFWRGRCLLIVQPTGGEGKIVVQAQADGLNSTVLDLDVETVS